MMDIIRSFLAADISDPARKEVAALVTSLEQLGADVGWVKPENLHFTLKFLGYASQDQVSRTKDLMASISLEQKSFSVHLAGLGGFPNLDRPAVLWVGLDEGAQAMGVLAQKLELGVSAIGFHEEGRPFSAHLTLGRVRSSRALSNLSQKIKLSTFSSSHRIVLDHLTFYKSTLTQQGPIYEVIAKTYFQKTLHSDGSKF